MAEIFWPKLTQQWAISMAIATVIAIGPRLGAAQTPPDSHLNNQIRQVEEAIKRGQDKKQLLDRTEADLRADLHRVRREKIRIATSIRETETRIYDLERQIRVLNTEETLKISELSDRQGQFSQALLALQRLSRLPTEVVLAYPAPPSDLVRTAILLKTAVPEIEARAMRLRENLTKLELTRKDITERKADLRLATTSLENRRSELDKLDTRKSDARAKTLAARQVEESRVKRLTEEAYTLRQLFTRLEQERVNQARGAGAPKTQQQFTPNNKGEPRRLEPQDALISLPPFEIGSITAARGKLMYPAIGAVTGNYDRHVNKGQLRKGLTIETRPGAQVVAPFNGQIVFSGPFRRYGHLLIIEHGEGYHSLLAGMAFVDGTVGQWLLAGEPIGSMARSQTGKTSLYIELRKHGQPVNPKPWLATEKG